MRFNISAAVYVHLRLLTRTRTRNRKRTRKRRTPLCIPQTRPHSFTLMHRDLRCICRGAQRNAVRRMCGLPFIFCTLVVACFYHGVCRLPRARIRMRTRETMSANRASQKRAGNCHSNGRIRRIEDACFPVYNVQPIRGWPCRMLNPIHPVQPRSQRDAQLTVWKCPRSCVVLSKSAEILLALTTLCPRNYFSRQVSCGFYLSRFDDTRLIGSIRRGTSFEKRKRICREKNKRKTKYNVSSLQALLPFFSFFCFYFRAESGFKNPLHPCFVNCHRCWSVEHSANYFRLNCSLRCCHKPRNLLIAAIRSNIVRNFPLATLSISF